MTRRRLLEIAVALAVLGLLLAVLLVRPTARQTTPPPPAAPRVALFRAVEGTPPDFAAEGFASLVARSPDGARTAVLFPVEFEVPADLWVMTGPDSGTRFVLVDSLRPSWTPKAVGWIDGDHLWVTIGFLYGTVSPGGDLFAVDPRDGSARLLWAAADSGRVQAVGASPGGPGGGIVVRLKAFDANLVESRDSTLTLPGEI